MESLEPTLYINSAWFQPKTIIHMRKNHKKVNTPCSMYSVCPAGWVFNFLVVEFQHHSALCLYTLYLIWQFGWSQYWNFNSKTRKDIDIPKVVSKVKTSKKLNGQTRFCHEEPNLCNSSILSWQKTLVNNWKICKIGLWQNLLPPFNCFWNLAVEITIRILISSWVWKLKFQYWLHPKTQIRYTVSVCECALLRNSVRVHAPVHHYLSSSCRQATGAAQWRNVQARLNYSVLCCRLQRTCHISAPPTYSEYTVVN